MRKIIYGLLILLTKTICFGQINIEHSYNGEDLTRVKLENSGEKYILMNHFLMKAIIYNADHTIWKTINLPPITEILTAKTKHASETKINSDSLMEIIYTFGLSSYTDSKYESGIINENDSVLLKIPGAFNVFLQENPGLPNKIIAYIKDTTTSAYSSNVYSVPGLSLEKTHTDGLVKRVILENSGEKYYLIDQTDKQVKIYNADHTLWKSVNLPIPIDATIGSYYLSETQINPDNLIEISYSYITDSAGVYSYESNIINENGAVLLTIPGATSIYLSNVPGLQNKIIANNKVYSIPSLTLENTYSNNITRVKLENSGEKYFLFNEINKQVLVYNADHTLWKTVNLSTGSSTNILFLSETKIDSDSQLEICYFYFIVNETVLCESRIINENGSILLTVTGSSSMALSEISGLQNKLIVPYYDHESIANVYNLPNSGSLISEQKINNFDVFVYPNPAKDKICLKIGQLTNLKNAILSIYNIQGQLIIQQNIQNETPTIDINTLSKGIFFIKITNDGNSKGTIFVKE